jgi:hypothetical protein
MTLPQGLFPVRFDVLGLAGVERAQVVVGLAFGPQQLVELGVDGLGITVLGALDEQRHDPRRHRGDAGPGQRARIEHEPQHHLEADDEKGSGMSRRNADSGEPRAQPVHRSKRAVRRCGSTLPVVGQVARSET